MAAMPITMPVHMRTVSFSLKKIPKQTAESIIVPPFISGKKIIPGIFATSIRFSLLANTTLKDNNIAGTKNSLLYVTGCFSFFSDKASLNIFQRNKHYRKKQKHYSEQFGKADGFSVPDNGIYRGNNKAGGID